MTEQEIQRSREKHVKRLGIAARQRRARYDAAHGAGAAEARLAHLASVRNAQRTRDTERYNSACRFIFKLDPSDAEAAEFVATHGMK